MRYTNVFCVIVLLAASATASASPLIDVGDHSFVAGETKTIRLYVTGDVAVQGLDFYIQIGDGGTANYGDNTKPVITDVDIVGLGTVFYASNTGQSSMFQSPLLWAVSTTTNESITDTLSADGLLAYVTINTAGTTPGDIYPLLLKGTANGIYGDPGVDTEFAGISANITNGSIAIVPSVAGDANRDGKVDGSDVTILAGNWQMLSGASWEMGDFNDDGRVDGSDVTILAGNWQAGVTTVGTAVPEPGTIILLLSAIVSLAIWRQIYARRAK